MAVGQEEEVPIETKTTKQEGTLKNQLSQTEKREKKESEPTPTR